MADDTGNSAERKPNSAAQPPAQATPKIETGPLMTLYENLIKLVDPIGRTVVAFDAMAQSGPKAAGVIKDIASFGGSIGAAAGKFVGALDQSALDAQKAAKQGLGGLDVTTLNEQLRRGNLTIKDYVELMNKQGGSLQGLGKNTDEAGNRIIQMTDAARQMPGGLGETLRKYNFTLTDEMARIQAIGSMNATKVDMNNEKQRNSLARANAELALQIQSQANLTGKSRDAIEAELEERLKQPEVAAKMRLMTEDQRQSFIKNQVALSGFGEQAQKTAATIGIGGRISPEQRMFLQSLGGKGAAEFQRGAALAARGKRPEDQAAGRALMQKAMADAAVYRTSPQYANTMAQGGPLAEAFKKAQAEDTTSVRIRQLLEKNPSLTPAQAMRQARQEAGVVKPGEGTKPGQEIAVGRQNLEGKANEAAIEASKQINIYTKAEGGAQALYSALDKLGDKLFDVKGSGDEARKKLKEVVDELNGVATAGGKPNDKNSPTYAAPTVPKFDKNAPPATQTTPPVTQANPKPTTQTTPPVTQANPKPTTEASPKPTTEASPKPATQTAPPVTQASPKPATEASPKSATEASPKPATESAPPVTQASPKPATESAPKPSEAAPKIEVPQTTAPVEPKKEESALKKAWNNWFGDKPPVSRANTSLIETGSLIEKFSPKGTPALLHKEEGVVNLEQLNNLARGSKNSGIESMMSNIKSYTGNVKSSPTDGNLNFSKMLDGVKTKVSSINTPKVDYNPNEYVNSALKTSTTIEEPKTTSTTTATTQQAPTISAETVSLKDVNEQLIRLNTGIMQLVQHSAKAVDLNQAQVKATKSLSGNKFA